MILFSKPVKLIIALLLTGSAFSQTPDTLVVYEYIHVTDTVWIESPLPENLSAEKIILSDTMYSKTPPEIFFNEESATLSKMNIIKENNLKNEKMSKTGWITFLLLSMNTTIYAQQKWNLKAGAEGMWLQHHTSTIGNPMWSGAYLGVERQFNFSRSRVSISTGLKAAFMSPPSEYKQLKEIDETLPAIEYDYAKIYTRILLDELNTGLFTLNYLQVSLPLKFNVKLGNWQPFAGFELSHMEFLNSHRVIGTSTWHHQIKTRFNLIAFQGGVTCRIKSHLSVSAKFAKSVNSIYNSLNIPEGLVLGNNDYYFKTIGASLGINYVF
ncbi:hypothetical protein [Roseimarinus sediminis]|uniref:hypothetical protein n=1 Tax=Roseimarinus sediminis TaxID=1610899 RepID=UPI003D1D4C3D